MSNAKAPKKTTTKAVRPPRPRWSVADVMGELEAAGSAQTRKTYTRHGAEEPMFGVSFATLKLLTKRIDVDHELALALWETGNFDARNLAVKIVDPVQMTPAELDRWAREASGSRTCGGYAAMLAAEGSHGAAKVEQWLGSKDERERGAGWTLLGQLAQRDVALKDAFFDEHLAAIERTIHVAPNGEREVMNQAIIAIGLRSAGLRRTAIAAARRVGTVEVDHGDTACKTPDAEAYIEKTWAHATSKGFTSPAELERTRATPRRRC